ncbi:MAG: hypothetical protein HY675_22965 [Chloroflexi bacterium]|nr:hypothetical protein [Chloroflexota bacterium]
MGGPRRQAPVVVALLVIVAMALFSQAGPVVRAADVTPSPALPGVTLPEADDFAKVVLGDPWDMIEITDIRKEWSYNLSSVSVAGGVLTAVSGTDTNPNNGAKSPGNPQLYLLFPGWPSTANVGKLGKNYPIDAARYKQLSFRMYLDAASATDVARVYWATDETFGSWGYSNGMRVYAGWNTYVINLATIGRFAGNSDWGNIMRALRLDPTTSAGVTIQIDWVRLTPLDTAATTQNITWTTTDPAARVSLYATDTSTGGRFATIATNLRAGQGSYGFGTAALAPGDYWVRAETTTDWATMVRGNTWDMNETTGDVDIYTSGPLAPHATTTTFTTTADGTVLSGVSSTARDNPYILLSFPPTMPIEGSTFYNLSIRLRKPGGPQGFGVWWGNTESESFWGGIVRNTSGGWNTYTVDMRTFTDSVGNPIGSQWVGKQIRYIRIDPIWDPPTTGMEWDIDWVALTTGNTPTGEGDLAATVAFSPGRITINDAPYISITKPSMTSGEDYATAQLGSLGGAWDMASVIDVPSLLTASTLHGQNPGDAKKDDIRDGYDFTGGVLNATTYGTPIIRPEELPQSDNWLYLNTAVNLANNAGGVRIDSRRYKYLTFRYMLDGAQDTSGGWVARVIWWTLGLDQDVSVTQDIVIDEGWNTYSFDLRGVSLESGLDYGWRGDVKYFRFDPNEVPAATTFHLDDVKLTADDEAGDTYSITWQAGGNSGAVVDLYWGLNPGGLGTLRPIASGVAGNISYSWNTTAIRGSTNTRARVYVYAIIRDSYNQTSRSSVAPVVVTLDTSFIYSLYLPALMKN